MKLMTLLDCIPQDVHTYIVDSDEIIIWSGYAINVPETFWDREVYLIIPDMNELSIIVM